MTVYYMDEFGTVAVEVDFGSIQFWGGEAYFTANGEEYRVKLNRLIEIVG